MDAKSLTVNQRGDRGARTIKFTVSATTKVVIDTKEEGFDPPDPFRFIHWLLPGPIGSQTQILNLPGFGLDVDPSTIGDFKGFTAYAVVAGKATDLDGKEYDVELDVRGMKGHFIGQDGKRHYGTFAFF